MPKRKREKRDVKIWVPQAIFVRTKLKSNVGYAIKNLEICAMFAGIMNSETGYVQVVQS